MAVLFFLFAFMSINYANNGVNQINNLRNLSQVNKYADIIDCEMKVTVQVVIYGVGATAECTGTGHAETSAKACEQAAAAVKDCVKKVLEIF